MNARDGLSVSRCSQPWPSLPRWRRNPRPRSFFPRFVQAMRRHSRHHVHLYMCLSWYGMRDLPFLLFQTLTWRSRRVQAHYGKQTILTWFWFFWATRQLSAHAHNTIHCTRSTLQNARRCKTSPSSPRQALSTATSSGSVTNTSHSRRVRFTDRGARSWTRPLGGELLNTRINANHNQHSHHFPEKFSKTPLSDEPGCRTVCSTVCSTVCRWCGNGAQENRDFANPFIISAAHPSWP